MQVAAWATTIAAPDPALGSGFGGAAVTHVLACYVTAAAAMMILVLMVVVVVTMGVPELIVTVATAAASTAGTQREALLAVA
jgi:hypothetical protein